MNTTVNFTPILQDLLDVAGLIVSGLIVYGIRAGAAYLNTHTKIAVSQAEVDALTTAASDAASHIEGKLAAKTLSVGELHTSNPTVAAVAEEAYALGSTVLTASKFNAPDVAGKALALVTQRLNWSTSLPVGTPVSEPTTVGSATAPDIVNKDDATNVTSGALPANTPENH